MKSPSAYVTAAVALAFLAALAAMIGARSKGVGMDVSAQTVRMGTTQRWHDAKSPRPRSDRAHGNRACEEMAARYRAGEYDEVEFFVLEDYFRRRVGVMTTTELKQLLGEPRVVIPGDSYYLYALATVYDDDSIESPERAADGLQGQHDQVLHYGEYGPPEHRIPDESMNLFFVTKDNTIVGMRTLFP
jgi:hypothetical protein